jgi:hypothetical protein
MTRIEILLNAALAAAWHGWPVFPLHPGSKRPALHGQEHCPGTGACTDGHRKWEQRATLDPELIRATWQRAPYNIGLATGPARLLVVDLDKPKSSADMPDGMTTFKALCERNGQPVPTTRRVHTASGGQHLYFTAPTGIRLGNTAGTLAPLVDTRGWGGYVVGAGSLIGDRAYDMTELLEPAPLPHWLTAALAPPPSLPRPNQPRPALRPAAVRRGYAGAALGNEEANVANAPEGTRNRALLRAARALGRFIPSGDLTRMEIEDALKRGAESAGLLPREYWPTITAALDWSIRNNPPNAA